MKHCYLCDKESQVMNRNIPMCLACRQVWCKVFVAWKGSDRLTKLVQDGKMLYEQPTYIDHINLGIP